MTEPAFRGAESPRRAVLLRLLLPVLLPVLLPLAGVLQGCTPEQAPPSGEVFPPAVAGLPIALSAGEIASGGVSGGVPVPSRALIGDLGDLAGDGFVGWATWNYTQQGQTTPTYSDHNVFGENGTKVYYSVDGNSVKWDYAPTRYWQVGSYNFAAVLPASVFSASHKMDIAGDTNGSYTGEFRKDEEDNLKLFLDFGTGGFKLGGINQETQEKQTDLMVAFTNKTVTIDQLQPEPETPPGPVTLNFSHALAKINIKISNKITADGGYNPDINISSIKLYGNSSVATAANFTPTYEDDELIVSSQFTGKTMSSQESPYYEYGTVRIDNDSEIDFVTNLLVFPESCDLKVEVTYTEGSFDNKSFTKYAQLYPQWQGGHEYTYNLELTQSEFVIVSWNSTPWTGCQVDHEFN